MVAGGHFAGLVVRVRRPDGDEEEEESLTGKKKKKQKPKPEIEVLKHKTFHRYTSTFIEYPYYCLLITSI